MDERSIASHGAYPSSCSEENYSLFNAERRSDAEEPLELANCEGENEHKATKDEPVGTDKGETDNGAITAEGGGSRCDVNEEGIECASTSSGSSVPPAWVGIDGHKRDLPQRLKVAEKCCRQQDRSIRAVEDRLEWLERDMSKLLITQPREEDPSNDFIYRIPAISQVNWLSWEEYCKGRGMSVPPNHHAIDVLIEEPVISAGSKPIGKHHMTTPIGAKHGFVDRMICDSEQERKSLFRIRLNSRPLCQILETIVQKEHGLRKNYTDPIVILTPFKLLAYHESSIMDYALHLEEKWGAQNQSEGQPVDEGNKDHPQYSPRILHHMKQVEKFKSMKTFETLAAEDKVITGQKADADPTILTAKPAPNTKLINDSKPSTQAAEWQEASTDQNLGTHDQKGSNELLDSREALDDLRCLVKVMNEFLRPRWKRLRDPVCEPEQTIHFLDLWHLFHPGQLIYVRDKECPQKVWRTMQATGGRKFLKADEDQLFNGRQKDGSAFTIQCYYLDFDGSSFDPSYHTFEINRFEDGQTLEFLDVIPFFIAEKAGLVDRDEMIQRGEQFVECKHVLHWSYSGHSLTHSPNGEPLSGTANDGNKNMGTVLSSTTIESPVIIDFGRTLQMNPQWAPNTSQPEPYQISGREYEEEWGSDFSRDCIEEDYVWDNRRREDYLAGCIWMVDQRKGIIPEGDDLLLLPDRVFGFVLRTRKWACLQLGLDDDGNKRLSKIETKAEGWDDLQLPGRHKHIIQSLVESHFGKHRSKSVYYDLVRDKGRGLIVLLHGAPGVGKTSTAECVAETNGKPLLPITCGDLGLTPTEVEDKLTGHFELAQAWDCVLLLDEADVFLAQRTSSDLERNALVSVFLRILEYYEGLLFLTTNRVGAMDEAFKSRVHMALYYPSLDLEKTLAIWRSQIRRARERLGELEIGEKNENDIISFAVTHFQDLWNLTGEGPGWNGRQIRNAFQSALALARHRSKQGNTPLQLKVQDLEDVAKASREFDDYLMSVQRGKSDSDIARRNMVREDRYGINSSQSHVSPNMDTPPIFPMNLGGSVYSRPPQPHQQQQHLRPSTPLQNLSAAQQGGQYMTPPTKPQYQQPNYPYNVSSSAYRKLPSNDQIQAPTMYPPPKQSQQLMYSAVNQPHQPESFQDSHSHQYQSLLTPSGMQQNLSQLSRHQQQQQQQQPYSSAQPGASSMQPTQGQVLLGGQGGPGMSGGGSSGDAGW